MKSLTRSTVTPFQNRSSHQRCSIKKLLLKISQSVTGKPPVLESLFNKVADLQACNVIKKRLQYVCFPVNITKSLRTAILKIICKRLLPLELFCKDFVNISYENTSFSIPEESIWLKPIYFLTTIAFWLMKYLFLIDGDILRVLTKHLTPLCRIYRSNQPSWNIHGTASINFDCFTMTNQIK